MPSDSADRPSGSATDAADVAVTREFDRRFVRGLERRAGELELAARLERDRRPALFVEEADQMAAVLDPLPAEAGVHAVEERPDSCVALIRDWRMPGSIEQDLLVFGSDAQRFVALATGLEPRRERVARFDNFPIDDVASHSGLRPCGRRSGQPRLDRRAGRRLQLMPLAGSPMRC